MNDRLKVEPSWMSLQRLIETRMVEIIRKEQGNGKHIRLYEAGAYWHAFEESAFQLGRLFENGEIILFRHKDYPFPAVMISISDDELRAYIRQHIPICDKPGYKELLAPELSAADYRSWHQSTVEEFL